MPKTLAKLVPPRFHARFTGISWRDVAITFGPILLIGILAIWLAIRFVHPAPPNTISIITGPEGSNFWLIAEKYRKILERDGVKLKILPSEGSLENLQRLNDPAFHVDVGFVQGGISTGMPLDRLISLGSVSRMPLLVFYRGIAPVNSLSQFRGKKLAIGSLGSGGRALSLALLKANDIEPGGATMLMGLSGEDAADALTRGKIDAAFLMGDSATSPVMRALARTPGIKLLDFTQAEAYTRRFSYLNALKLPMGVFDFGKNLPEQDTHLIGPAVELVAHENLHPALSDLLIEAAKEVHGRAGLLQKAGEFPAPLEHEFRISDDAARYYRSGKGLLYRSLPFWLATLLDRALVVLVPVVVLLVPGLRLVPWLYSWRVRSQIYRWYGALIAIERSAFGDATPEERGAMLKRLGDIEIGVNKMKIPLAFADQFYVLREHINFVRDRLVKNT